MAGVMRVPGQSEVVTVFGGYFGHLGFSSAQGRSHVTTSKTFHDGRKKRSQQNLGMICFILGICYAMPNLLVMTQ